MPRPEKVAAVAEIRERLEGAQAVFLAEYAGLSVKAQQELRRGLRAQGAEFKVVKMTLARRAASELDLQELDPLLLGPTGLTFADTDPVAAAKVLKDFAAGHEVFVVKGGLLGSTLLSAQRVGELADIEPREVLLARLAGAMKAPMTAMAGLMMALPRGAATVLQQLLDKRHAAAEEIGAAADAAGEGDAAGAAAADVAEEGAPEDADGEPRPEPEAESAGAEPPAEPAAAAVGSATEDQHEDDDAAGQAEEE